MYVMKPFARLKLVHVSPHTCQQPDFPLLFLSPLQNLDRDSVSARLEPTPLLTPSHQQNLREPNGIDIWWRWKRNGEAFSGEALRLLQVRRRASLLPRGLCFHVHGVRRQTPQCRRQYGRAEAREGVDVRGVRTGPRHHHLQGGRRRALRHLRPRYPLRQSPSPAPRAHAGGSILRHRRIRGDEVYRRHFRRSTQRFNLRPGIRRLYPRFVDFHQLNCYNQTPGGGGCAGDEIDGIPISGFRSVPRIWQLPDLLAALQRQRRPRTNNRQTASFSSINSPTLAGKPVWDRFHEIRHHLLQQ